MSHDEVRNKLRTQYQGKMCWEYELGDHSDSNAPKNVLSCWVVEVTRIEKIVLGKIEHRNAEVLYLFEMSDRQDEEQGFELLVALDSTNTLHATWAALDKLVGKEQ